MTRSGTEMTRRTALESGGTPAAKSAATPRHIEPVKLWATLGAVLLGFEAYLLVRWFAGSEFERVSTGPDSPPDWMKAELVGAQIVMTALALYLLARFVFRPLWTERRLTTDGMACIGAVLVSIYDPASNYLGNCSATTPISSTPDHP